MSIFTVTAIISVLVDQISKFFIETFLYEKSTLFFTYLQNKGAAWGIFSDNELFLKLITPVLILIIALYFSALSKNKFEFFIGGLVVGGALGNYIDRLFRGHVVDFIDFKVWPIFNVADICIVVGCLLYIVYLVKNGSKNVANKRGD